MPRNIHAWEEVMTVVGRMLENLSPLTRSGDTHTHTDAGSQTKLKRDSLVPYPKWPSTYWLAATKKSDIGDRLLSPWHDVGLGCRWNATHNEPCPQSPCRAGSDAWQSNESCCDRLYSTVLYIGSTWMLSLFYISRCCYGWRIVLAVRPSVVNLNCIAFSVESFD